MQKAKKQAAFYAAVFILPFGILYSMFVIWPVLQGMYVSLHKWSLMGNQGFIGLENYAKFISDNNFWSSLRNTFTFVILTAPAMVIISMILALLANRKSIFKKFFRVSFYLPSVLSVAVASFIARYMFSAHTGLINGVLMSLGVIESGDELIWLQEINLAWFSVVSTTIWWTVGFSMMVFISALQEIPGELMEAAEVDGASKTRQLFSITLPLLKPTTYLVALLQIIGSFKVFGQIHLVTGGGPAGQTRSLIMYIYQEGFEDGNMGYAASMSYVLFAILVVLTLVQLYIQKKQGV